MDEGIIRNMWSYLQKYNKIVYSRISLGQLVTLIHDARTHEHKIFVGIIVLAFYRVHWSQSVTFYNFFVLFSYALVYQANILC